MIEVVTHIVDKIGRLSRVVLEDLVDGVGQCALGIFLHALERVFIVVQIVLAQFFERLNEMVDYST